MRLPLPPVFFSFVLQYCQNLKTEFHHYKRLPTLLLSADFHRKLCIQQTFTSCCMTISPLSSKIGLRYPLLFSSNGFPALDSTLKIIGNIFTYFKISFIDTVSYTFYILTFAVKWHYQFYNLLYSYRCPH